MHEFPFAYFGHAYSEYVIVDVCVWFEREPSADERAIIENEFGAVHAFWGRSRNRVAWSQNVASYSKVVDAERTEVSARDPRVVAALKSHDAKLYGTVKHPMKAVPFALHLMVDQALLALHHRFPIAFATRKQGPRDRQTGWHDWSVRQRGRALQRMSEFLAASPSNVTQLGAFAHVSPWVEALAQVARSTTKRTLLKSLSAAERGALADFFLLASLHTVPPQHLGENSAARSDLEEAHGALLALADKLAGARTPMKSPHDWLVQIQKEALQFEFTRVKLSECPTFELVKKEPSLRFDVAIAATEKTLRELEALSGNKPGATGLTFGSEDQQRLQVLQKVVTELFRGKGSLTPDQALQLLRVLTSSIRPLGSWVEVISSKLADYVRAHGQSPSFVAALAALRSSPYALGYSTPQVRGFFDSLSQPLR